MLKFFTKITGDDYNMLLNDTPSSRKKVVLFANILFVPVLAGSSALMHLQPEFSEPPNWVVYL